MRNAVKLITMQRREKWKMKIFTTKKLNFDQVILPHIQLVYTCCCTDTHTLIVHYCLQFLQSPVPELQHTLVTQNMNRITVY